MVAEMVACGLDYSQIAFVFNCSPQDIKFYYKDELEHGLAITNSRVGAALLRNALGGDVQAQKFWLATRGGWAPPTPEDQKKNQANAQLTNERRQLMDAIVTMVATTKERDEKAEVTSRANNAGVQ